MTRAQRVVDDIQQLVSLPDVCIKVNRLVDSPDYSAAAVGEIIAQDADLSARLLRLVNSALFGLRAPVDTISRAVALIGSEELRNLAMATAATRVFTGVPGDLVNMAEFWRYGVTTGVVARELAEHSHVLHSERLFVMGVLHDIGRLAIYLRLPEQARDILLICGGDDHLLVETEESVIGCNHMQVGAELLRKWRLPEALVTVVGSHHRPLAAGDYRLDACLVHLASAVANGEANGLAMEETLESIEPGVWELTGLDPQQLAASRDALQDELAALMGLVLSPADRNRHQS